jgi:hypothetical protein
MYGNHDNRQDQAGDVDGDVAYRFTCVGLLQPLHGPRRLRGGKLREQVPRWPRSGSSGVRATRWYGRGRQVHIQTDVQVQRDG